MVTRSVEQAIEQKAQSIGFKDALLTVLFTAAGFLLTGIADSLLPFLDTAWDGDYAWTKPVVAILIGAAVKGLDRKKHEDPSPSTGLLSV